MSDAAQPCLTPLLLFWPVPLPCLNTCAGLNFLSVYAALSLAYHTHNSPGALVLAAVAVGLGVFKVGLLCCIGFSNRVQLAYMLQCVCCAACALTLQICPCLLPVAPCVFACLPCADMVASVPWLPHLASGAGGGSAGGNNSSQLVQTRHLMGPPSLEAVCNWSRLALRSHVPGLRSIWV